MGVGAVIRGFGQSIKDLIAYDPSGIKTVKYSSIKLKNTEGHDFAFLTPSIYNLASNAAEGSFATAKNPDELLEGKGNISKILRQKAKLEKKIEDLKAKFGSVDAELSALKKPLSESKGDLTKVALVKSQKDALSNEIKTLSAGLNAWNEQVAYLRQLGRDYVQFNAWRTFVEYEAAQEKHNIYKSENSKNSKHTSKIDRSKKKLDAQKAHLDQTYNDYLAVLNREPYPKDVDGRIFTREGDELTLDSSKAATFALRPGTFASQEEADNAIKLMITELRGVDLPPEAMILLPENPSHNKILGYVKKPKSPDLALQIPTQVSPTEITLEKEWYQFTAEEKVLPAVSFVFGLVFTAVTTAMMAAFLFTLFTPLGAPLWSIALMASVIFVIDLANNRDDWQGRTARIIDPFKRVFNSLFHPEKFDNRSNEKLSIPRALLTGFLLIVIGFDLGAVTVGSALGFKEFAEGQFLAKIHPIGMMVMTAMFGIWVANSVISPFFGETLSRIGLFFREPIATHKYDPRSELPVILQNKDFRAASEDAEASANNLTQKIQERRDELKARLNHASDDDHLATSSLPASAPIRMGGENVDARVVVRRTVTASNVRYSYSHH